MSDFIVGKLTVLRDQMRAYKVPGKRKKTPGETRQRGQRRSSTSRPTLPAPEPVELLSTLPAPEPVELLSFSKTWMDALCTFLELSRLESKKIRLQVLQLRRSCRCQCVALRGSYGG